MGANLASVIKRLSVVISLTIENLGVNDRVQIANPDKIN